LTESDIKSLIKDNLSYKDYNIKYNYGTGDICILEPIITYLECVILIDIGKLYSDNTEIFMSLTIPFPQKVTQKSIRTTYFQSNGNFGYAEFKNDGFEISLTRVFFNGIQYSPTMNVEDFKKVTWSMFARYII